MDDFRIEYFIEDDKGKQKSLSNMTEKETEQWQRDMETRALNEYYKKVKVTIKKF